MDNVNPQTAQEATPETKVPPTGQGLSGNRDQRQQEFEERQEQNRLEFESRMEAKKAKRDWLTIVFAGVAAICAIWAAYEAHDAGKTSHDALKAEQESVDIQRESMQTQIEAMRRAEQPFVYPKPGQWKALRYADGFEVSVSIAPVISGKTPVFNVESRLTCVATPTETKIDLRPAEAPMVRHTSFSFDEPEQEPMETMCRTQQGAGADNDTKIRIDHVVVFAYGQFTYDDLFGAKHHTPFCFQQIVYPYDKPQKLGACDTTLSATSVD